MQEKTTLIKNKITNNIPTEWHLCDGQNSTVDLRGRFIVGFHSNRGEYSIKDSRSGDRNIDRTTNAKSQPYGYNGDHSHS